MTAEQRTKLTLNKQPQPNAEDEQKKLARLRHELTEQIRAELKQQTRAKREAKAKKRAEAKAATAERTAPKPYNTNKPKLTPEEVKVYTDLGGRDWLKQQLQAIISQQESAE